MRFSDILRLCRQNLWRRKSRTILTVLGVIVGCCSIVLMISLGQGINEQNEKMLKSMGDLSIVTVYTSGGYAGPMGGGNGSSSASSDAKLDDKALESFRSMSGVSGVTPIMDFPYNVTAKAGAGGRYIYDHVQIMGIDMSQFEQMGYKMVDGSKPTTKDQVLAGEWFAYGFMDTLKNGEMRTGTRGSGYSSCTFNSATGECEPDQDEDPFFDPLTTQISLTTGTNYQGDPYVQNMYGGGGGTTVGSDQSDNVTIDLRASGIIGGDYNKGYATADGLVMDLQALKDLRAKVDPAAAKKTVNYDQVLVKAADLSSVPKVESQIKALGYETSSYEDMRKSLEEQSRAIQLILGGIGAVSLLVAAIGIANTMVMSVTERTREIGIMKALGCYVRDIRVMFLTEAGAIGFFGGLIGCMLSGLISLGINVAGRMYAGGMVGSSNGSSGDGAGGTSIWMIMWQALVGGEDVTRYSVIPWWLFLFAVLFSTLIGLLFGFGPANKAVKIPALDAIKNNE
ncbi:ABC transporter permease [Bifidobacterium breve]|uniref:ABC transporter permease n=1 Tax=Bifidobacterium breve TaxID=1685 RepID=UPI0029C3436F|nr:ABC transporter permease [Bifidobacterium breve]MDX5142168.1 ABC transporter permease [Bifidobacterium breve]